MRDDRKTLAEAVRKACLEAAMRAYEDAGMSGLCEEGRWECAVQAIRQLDLERVIEEAAGAGDTERQGAGGGRAEAARGDDGEARVKPT